MILASNNATRRRRVLPPWFRQPIPDPLKIRQVRSLIERTGLHTVCQEARCPNIGYCWQKGTATFMILGDTCTRCCRFCAVSSGRPDDINPEEPRLIAQSIRSLGLRYAVITSVTRDDLPDGGAGHYAETCRMIRRMNPGIKIELLIPDFRLNHQSLNHILECRPDVIGHNVETVSSLYPLVRPQADYQQSLAVLKYLSQPGGNIIIKSGFMVGLGETESQIKDLIFDLSKSGCSMLTIGQYLAPTQSQRHVPVQCYVSPEDFERYRKLAYDRGLRYVVAGPLVRSSFMAEEGYRAHRQTDGLSTKRTMKAL